MPRVIIVTGSNGGLGQAIAQAFLAESDENFVWLGIHHRRELADKLAAAHPGRCQVIELDVTQAASWLQAGDRIQRIRQTGSELAPSWRLPASDPIRTAGGDPWVMRLVIGAGACFALMLILWVGFYFALGSGVDSLQAIGRTIQ